MILNLEKTSTLKKLFLFVSMLVVAQSACSAAENVVTLAVTPFCPMSCNLESDGVDGYQVEIARAAFAGAGYILKLRHVRSWARAVMLVNEGEVDGMIPMLSVVAEVSGEILIPKEFIRETRDISLIHKDTQWRYKETNSLDSIRMVGAVSGGDWGRSINIWMRKNPQKILWLHGDNAYSRGLELLQSKRIDTIIDVDEVLYYHRSRLNLADELISGGTTLRYYAFIGFTKKSPRAEEYNQIVQSQVRKMRRNGELDSLFVKYGLAK